MNSKFNLDPVNLLNINTLYNNYFVLNRKFANYDILEDEIDKELVKVKKYLKLNNLPQFEDFDLDIFEKLQNKLTVNKDDLMEISDEIEKYDDKKDDNEIKIDNKKFNINDLNDDKNNFDKLNEIKIDKINKDDNFDKLNKINDIDDLDDDENNFDKSNEIKNDKINKDDNFDPYINIDDLDDDSDDDRMDDKSKEFLENNNKKKVYKRNHESDMESDMEYYMKDRKKKKKIKKEDDVNYKPTFYHLNKIKENPLTKRGKSGFISNLTLIFE